MPARLLTDEDVPQKVGSYLHSVGHDVVPLRSFSADPRGDRIEDAQVLELAIRFKRVLITRNGNHFRALHRERRCHHGIIIVRDMQGGRGPEHDEAVGRLVDDFLRDVGMFNSQLAAMKCRDGVWGIEVESADS